NLLEEAVAAAKGEPQERAEERPVIVELTLDAYLPPGYVMDEIERVDLYRRASGLRSLAEVEDLVEELVDRFGELPEPSRNLLGLSRVKILARQSGASSVTFRSGNLTVTGATAGSAAAAFIRRATGGTVTTRTGRISVRADEQDPLTLAEETLRALIRSR
ncbi:MAG TPA: TRCF domain-containing protein, partial [Rubrobacter sp.]|nr:TRCF domain-containing protein [Rubrobacter sp.]